MPIYLTPITPNLLQIYGFSPLRTIFRVQNAQKRVKNQKICPVAPSHRNIFRNFAPAFEIEALQVDPLAQQVEHNTFNVGVLGSSPKRITRTKPGSRPTHGPLPDFFFCLRPRKNLKSVVFAPRFCLKSVDLIGQICLKSVVYVWSFHLKSVILHGKNTILTMVAKDRFFHRPYTKEMKTYQILLLLLMLCSITAQTQQRPINNDSSGYAQANNQTDNHEYVDLGLPSGIKWATCNVGAKRPKDYGDYFAWGETSPKSSCTEIGSTTFKKSNSQLRSSGILGSNNNLAPAYDVARHNWGGSWRVPTLDDFNELIDHTWTVWATQGGICGRKLTSKINGKSIFLPAAGCRYGAELYYDGTHGYYWSATPNESRAGGAHGLGFDSDDYVWYDYSRSYGFSVRPVSE